MIEDPVNDQVEGNQQVQDLLNKWKTFAEKGDMRFAALVACRTSEDVVTDCAGAQGTEFAAYFGLDELKRTLSEHLKNRSIAIQQDPKNTDPSLWIYSVAQWTVGYDFFQWLLNVEVLRRQEGIEEPLKVHFYPGQDGSWDKALNNEPRKQMFYKVCKPMVALLGGEVTEATNGRYLDHTNSFSYAPVVKAYKAGVELPKFAAPEWAREQVAKRLGDRHPVVITLRETELHKYRNSNPDFFKFAKWLQDKGEDILFLRDTSKFDQPLVVDGVEWETYPEASTEIEIRMAVYERAKLCYFGSNGPFGLVTVSDIPWICIYPLDASKSYKYNNPNVWEYSMGIKPGEQFPWARPDQKIILENDSFDNLVKSWEDLGK